MIFSSWVRLKEAIHCYSRELYSARTTAGFGSKLGTGVGSFWSLDYSKTPLDGCF